MKDIKELALKTLDAMAEDGLQVHNITYESGNTGVELDEPALDEFATRLIAAYLADPVAWRTHHDEPMLFPTINEAWQYCEDDEGPEPLFAAPVKDSLTTEPAPSEFSAEQRDKDWSAFKGAAPSSEEVQSSLKWLRKAEFGAMQEYASRIADMIECLAAHTDYLETVISEHGADMWAQGEEYAVLSAKCAKALIRVGELEQLLAARVPDGCVVVPREATDEMLLAAESVKQYELSTPRLRWEAMIAAWEVKP